MPSLAEIRARQAEVAAQLAAEVEAAERHAIREAGLEEVAVQCADVAQQLEAVERRFAKAREERRTLQVQNVRLRRQRSELIIRLRDEGVSAERLAEATGLTTATVKSLTPAQTLESTDREPAVATSDGQDEENSGQEELAAS